MKNYIILIFLFSKASIFCQNQKRTLEMEYDSAKFKLNPIFHEMLLKFDQELFESQGNGAAIFLKDRMDIIQTNNDYSNWGKNEFDKIEQDLWIAASELIQGTLIIHVGQAFGNEFLKCKVNNGVVKI